MKIKLGFSKSKKEWDDFLINCNGSFLQSYSWGDFKKKYQKIWRIEAKKNNKIVGIAQVFEERFLFWKYLYIPYGPVSQKKNIRDVLIKKTKEVIGANFVFLLVEPSKEVSFGEETSFRIQPQKTIVLNIKKKDNELLSGFNKSTRYNTKLAIKKGVVVEKESDLDSFFSLLESTKERQGFNTYNKDYFEKLLTENRGELHLAKYKGSVIAGNIVLYFGKNAYCLHSANDYKNRDLKGANILRFESFKMARDTNCSFFDEWGIDEKRFPGVTDFKKGFGGDVVFYPNGKVFVIKKIQYLFCLFFMKLKKIIR